MQNVTLSNYLNDMEKELSVELKPSDKGIDFLKRYSRAVAPLKSKKLPPVISVFNN